MGSRLPWIRSTAHSDNPQAERLESLIRAALQQARRNHDPATVEDLNGVLELIAARRSGQDAAL